jgi:hypothetical protein
VVEGTGVISGCAEYYPSPISGMGMSLVIIGAYVLAGEVAAYNGDGTRV